MLVIPLDLSWHKVCVRHLWDIRPYTLSWVFLFLFSGSFVKAFLWSTLRMVQSILTEGSSGIYPFDEISSICCIAWCNYTYTCGNKINNNDERTHFFRKNIPLIRYSKWLRKGYERVMRERWVEDWTNCNILTHNSFVFSSISFSFCWTAQSEVLKCP